MRLFRPLLSGASLPDRVAAGLGALFGVMLTGLFAALAAGQWPAPWLVAPIGASAVLVFAVPASPLAQPWPVIGGNMLSAVVALIVVRLIPAPALATGVAVGAAIVFMSIARCLHPPGGAVALSVVLMSATGSPAGWLFPLLPVALDSALLVCAGVAFHRVSGHAYPHRAVAAAAPSAFAPEDVDAALADMHESFDIGRDDLDALLAGAARHATIRRERSARSSPRR